MVEALTYVIYRELLRYNHRCNHDSCNKGFPILMLISNLNCSEYWTHKKKANTQKSFARNKQENPQEPIPLVGDLTFATS